MTNTYYILGTDKAISLDSTIESFTGDGDTILFNNDSLIFFRTDEDGLRVQDFADDLDYIKEYETIENSYFRGGRKYFNLVKIKDFYFLIDTYKVDQADVDEALSKYTSYDEDGSLADFLEEELECTFREVSYDGIIEYEYDNKWYIVNLDAKHLKKLNAGWMDYPYQRVSYFNSDDLEEVLEILREELKDKIEDSFETIETLEDFYEEFCEETTEALENYILGRLAVVDIEPEDTSLEELLAKF